MPRSLVDPNARMLNHAEFVYPPGDRALAKRLFEDLGCRVLDPQTDPVPEALGPAGGAYLIVYLDQSCEDLFDNVFYLSEVPSAQWEFEQQLGAALAGDEKLAGAHAAYREQRRDLPQATTHLGLAFPSTEALEAVMEGLASDEALAGRIHLSKVYRPGGPGSQDDRVVQSFVHTDICSNGLICFGQQFELQVRLDV
jgi:hypothetical protein